MLENEVNSQAFYSSEDQEGVRAEWTRVKYLKQIITLGLGPHNHSPEDGYCCLRFTVEETGAQRRGILHHGHMSKNEFLSWDD